MSTPKADTQQGLSWRLDWVNERLRSYSHTPARYGGSRGTCVCLWSAPTPVPLAPPPPGVKVRFLFPELLLLLQCEAEELRAASSGQVCGLRHRIVRGLWDVQTSAGGLAELCDLRQLAKHLWPTIFSREKWNSCVAGAFH